VDQEHDAATLADRLNETLGALYGFERELGGGGMSRVYVAVEKRYDRRVVVKVLASGLAAGVSSERFVREVRLAARLQQANIVPVFDSGQIDGLPYYDAVGRGGFAAFGSTRTVRSPCPRPSRSSPTSPRR
jgi:hypothetical protein